MSDELEVDETADNAADAKNWRKQMVERAAADARAEAQAEINQGKRELAFLKAGIDLENLTPTQRLFVKSYDGDPTVDAVKAAATEYGVIDVEQPAVPAEELAAHERLSNATSGATVQSDEQGYFSDMEKAETPADVLAVLTAAGITADYSKPGSRWANSTGQNQPATTPL